MGDEMRDVAREIGRIVLAERRWVFWGRVAWAVAGLAVGAWALVALKGLALRFGL